MRQSILQKASLTGFLSVQGGFFMTRALYMVLLSALIDEGGGDRAA